MQNIINPFNDVPRPSETKELTEALRRLSANLARGQAEIDREGREKRKQRVTVNSISPNGLLEYKSDGDTIYTSPSGKKYPAKFGKGTNPNLLLLYITQNLHKRSYQFDEFEKVLREPRSGGEDFSTENRVRETVRSIRKTMGFPKGEMIDIDYGVVLKCEVQVK